MHRNTKIKSAASSNKSKKQTIKSLLDIQDCSNQTESKNGHFSAISPNNFTNLSTVNNSNTLSSRSTSPTKIKQEKSIKIKKKSHVNKKLEKSQKFNSDNSGKVQNNKIKKEIEKQEPGPISNEHFKLTNEEINLFESLMHREFDPNGGATILTVYQDELDTKLFLANTSQADLIDKFSTYFIKEVYSESKVEAENETDQITNVKSNDDLNETMSTKENQVSLQLDTSRKCEKAANYVLGIVRNSAHYMPDLLDYFADNHPTMTVKTSLLLNNKEINTLKISEYRKNVNSSYLNGTYRYGPLLQTSIVGIRNEEIGGYFPNLIEIIEKNSFLKKSLPWSKFSINENTDPQKSDDGPIIW